MYTDTLVTKMYHGKRLGGKMKDPKVAQLVKQFNKEIEALNKTWASLQKNNVYARVNLVGVNSYTDPKYIEVTELTQSVSYIEDK